MTQTLQLSHLSAARQLHQAHQGYHVIAYTSCCIPRTLPWSSLEQAGYSHCTVPGIYLRVRRRTYVRPYVVIVNIVLVQYSPESIAAAEYLVCAGE